MACQESGLGQQRLRPRTVALLPFLSLSPLGPLKNSKRADGLWNIEDCVQRWAAAEAEIQGPDYPKYRLKFCLHSIWLDMSPGYWKKETFSVLDVLYLFS